MRFEFDDKKSESNLGKHGVDFQDAQMIWADPTALLDVPAKTSDEPRWIAIGSIDGKLWTAVYTYRGKNRSTVRLISVRRARPGEERAYDEKI